jgi:hypothetical protein
MTPSSGGRLQLIGLADHTLELATEMGVTNCAEELPISQDNEEVVPHVPSESSVSACLEAIHHHVLKRTLCCPQPWKHYLATVCP